MNRKKEPDILDILAKASIVTGCVLLAALVLLVITTTRQNTNLKNYAIALEKNMTALNDNLRQYQGSARDKAKVEQDSMDYIRWKFVLKEQVDQANQRLMAKARDIKDVKKDKALGNLLYYNLGLSCTLATDFESAIKAFEEALKFDPNDAYSQYDLGMLYSTYKRDAGKAVKYYTRYLEIMPKADKAADVKERIESLKSKGI